MEGEKRKEALHKVKLENQQKEIQLHKIINDLVKKVVDKKKKKIKITLAKMPKNSHKKQNLDQKVTD